LLCCISYLRPIKFYYQYTRINAVAATDDDDDDENNNSVLKSNNSQIISADIVNAITLLILGFVLKPHCIY